MINIYIKYYNAVILLCIKHISLKDYMNKFNFYNSNLRNASNYMKYF